MKKYIFSSQWFVKSLAQPIKIDLNKELDPKQKAIQAFNIDA